MVNVGRNMPRGVAFFELWPFGAGRMTFTMDRPRKWILWPQNAIWIDERHSRSSGRGEVHRYEGI